MVYKIKFLTFLYSSVISVILRQWANSASNVVCGWIFVGKSDWFGILIDVLCFALMLVIVYPVYIKRVYREDWYELDSITMLLFVLLFSVLELVKVMAFNMSENEVGGILLCIAELMCCVFLLWQSVRIAKRNRERTERMVSEILLEKERKQFEMLKQNMENMKEQAHDLKYVMRAAKEGGFRGDAMDKLSAIAEMYDKNFNTGNAALDVILFDAADNFAKNKIKFECFIQNTDISFIDNFDLYSLFGNAFDNASEYLSGIEEEKRYVSLVLRSAASGYIFIEISNYYEGESNVYVGMKSSKKDSDMHGYGVKNMARIAEKYGGELSVKAENSAFYLTVVIPVSVKTL